MVVAVPQRRLHFSTYSKLIVCSDDEPDLLLTLDLVLKEHGYENVFCSLTLGGTLHLIKRLKPDLVITDMSKAMAPWAGLDIAQAVRSDPLLSHTCVALCTGYEFRPEWYPLFDAFLLKGHGCDKHTMMKFVRGCLEAADRAGH